MCNCNCSTGRCAVRRSACRKRTDARKQLSFEAQYRDSVERREIALRGLRETVSEMLEAVELRARRAV